LLALHKFSQILGFGWVTVNQRNFIYLESTLKASSVVVAIVVKNQFLVLVNIGPSHFLPTVSYHKLF